MERVAKSTAHFRVSSDTVFAVESVVLIAVLGHQFLHANCVGAGSLSFLWCDVRRDNNKAVEVVGLARIRVEVEADTTLAWCKLAVLIATTFKDFDSWHRRVNVTVLWLVQFEVQTNNASSFVCSADNVLVVLHVGVQGLLNTASLSDVEVSHRHACF